MANTSLESGLSPFEMIHSLPVPVQQYRTRQSQMLRAASMQHLVTFLERCTSGFSTNYGVGFLNGFHVRLNYSEDLTQKHKSHLRLYQNK